MTSSPIIVVHPSDEMYGADRMILKFILALPEVVRDRVEVWLPTDVPSGHFPLSEQLDSASVSYRRMDLPIFRRSLANPRGMAALSSRYRSVRQRVRKANAAAVVIGTTTALPVAVAVPRGVPVVLYQQEVWGDAERQVFSPMLRGVDRVIGVSEAARSSLPKSVRARSTVVPNCTSKPEHVTSLASHSGQMRYVVASRWAPRKGYELLLEAWQLAGSPGHLTILGGPPPSGRAVDVPELVGGLDLLGSVTLAGEVPDIGRELDAADAVILPSVVPESFGLVAIEAFAHARPAISTDLGGSPEVVRDGAGWLIPADRPEPLADLLRRLDRSEAARAGRRAAARFTAEYSFDAYERRIRGVLSEVWWSKPSGLSDRGLWFD